MEGTETAMAELDRISIARPDIGSLEKDNLRECVESGWISQGRYVDAAETLLRSLTGRQFAMCTSSGTTALLAAVLSLDLKWRPEEIAVPAFTFAAVHNAVEIAGFTPLYLAADMNDWQIHEKEWERIEGIRAVIVAPNYGKVSGSDIRGLVKPGTKIIEDAAESFLGSLDGKPAGSFGDISVVSFYANKICTAGEGGAILTDDKETADKIRTILNHGINNKIYKRVSIGLNGRMTDLQAAILCGQLMRSEEMFKKRLGILGEYGYACLLSKEEWKFPLSPMEETKAPWLFAGIPPDGAALIKRCAAANIEWRPFFHVPEKATRTINMRMTDTVTLSRRGVCLPLSSAMTDSEVNRVCEVIRG